MKRMFLTLLLGGMTLSAVGGPAEVTDEARLLRFPATNGTEVVFSYAGDLFTAPSPVNMTATVRFTSSRRKAASLSV